MKHKYSFWYIFFFQFGPMFIAGMVSFLQQKLWLGLLLGIAVNILTFGKQLIDDEFHRKNLNWRSPVHWFIPISLLLIVAYYVFVTSDAPQLLIGITYITLYFTTTFISAIVVKNSVMWLNEHYPIK